MRAADQRVGAARRLVRALIVFLLLPTFVLPSHLRHYSLRRTWPLHACCSLTCTVYFSLGPQHIASFEFRLE